MSVKLTKLEEAELLTHNPKNIGRLLNMWKRYFDDWANEALFAHGYSYFKMAYMPFIMNISPTGSTNNEIAEKAKVSKQAMSKVVKELLEFGLIKVEKHSVDARVSHILLTAKGKHLVTDTKKYVLGLASDYEQLIGKKNYAIMIDSMHKIVSHHQALKQNENIEL